MRSGMEFKCFVIRRSCKMDFSILEFSCMTKNPDGSTMIKSFPSVRLRFDPPALPSWVPHIEEYEADLSLEMSDGLKRRRIDEIRFRGH